MFRARRPAALSTHVLKFANMIHCHQPARNRQEPETVRMNCVSQTSRMQMVNRAAARFPDFNSCRHRCDRFRAILTEYCCRIRFSLIFPALGAIRCNQLRA